MLRSAVPAILLTALLLVAAHPVGAAEIAWLPGYEPAVQQAKAEKKLALVAFFTPG